MKNTSIPALILTLTATTAMAVPLPPKSSVTHQSVADTLAPPSSGGMGWPGLPLGTTTWYRSLGLPVIAQTTQPDRIFAFPARVNGVGVLITAANDEGVMSNGPGYSILPVAGSPTVPVITEAAPLGTNFLGNLTGTLAAGTTLGNPAVERLQISSNGIVACQTFSNNGISVFREGIAANSNMRSLGAAGATLPMTARQPGVMDDQCMNIAAREQWIGPIPQRVNRLSFPGGFGVPMNPLPFPTTGWFVASGLPTPLGGAWWATQGAVTRLGSPSISESGVVAAHCIDNVGPTFTRPQIRIQDPFGSQAIVMRQGTPCGANPMGGANFFGVVNSSLMALNIRSITTAATKEVIAWQMTNMRNAPASGIINQPSLWCKQAGFPPAYIAHGGGVVAAPGILPLHSFDSFYSLHVTDDLTNPAISRVFFGVNLLPLTFPRKRAIYTCDVSGGVVGPLTLIATNVPGNTPLIPYSTGTDELATFGTTTGTSGHLFSVSRAGEVFFKATLGANISGPVPTAVQRQVLVVASPTTGYALQVWAQSGITSFTSMGGTTGNIFTNFTLTQPDQGTFSRGQGIATLPALGTSIAFRGHVVGGNQAVIIAY